VNRYRFIAVEKARYSVAQLCRVLQVAPSGFYAWRHRQPSRRALENAALTEQIRAIHERSRGTYGAPRVHADLHARKRRVSRKRVARLMRQAGLLGRPPRRFRRTTVADPKVQVEDLVQRSFTATAPDQKWFGDITVHPHLGGLALSGGHPRCVQSQKWWAGRWPTTSAPNWLELPHFCGHLKTGNTYPDGVRLNGQALEAPIHQRVQGRESRTDPKLGQAGRADLCDMGLSESTVQRWVAQAEVDSGQRDGLTTAEREELSRLRREMRVVREERDVLAKAIAFFTKATTR
jgi:hypothetical protein